jgi:hypothetical protein
MFCYNFLGDFVRREAYHTSVRAPFLAADAVVDEEEAFGIVFFLHREKARALSASLS